MLTCYDYATAALCQQAGVDCLLVGDSLAQVVLGHANTLSAGMDIMVTLAAAVRRGAPEAYLVGDMPFLSYQVSTAEAIRNAGRFLVEAGCDAVKLELDHRYDDLVAALARAGIPVMAHLGYRPQMAGQSCRVVETRAAEQACQLVKDAISIVEAGACALLLECVTTAAARAVTQRVEAPVIGCGSGPDCDGQVLVLHDVLGLSGAAQPRFSKTYARLDEAIRQAVSAYLEEVRGRRFPDGEHSYHMKPEDQERFDRSLAGLDRKSQPPKD